MCDGRPTSLLGVLRVTPRSLSECDQPWRYVSRRYCVFVTYPLVIVGGAYAQAGGITAAITDEHRGYDHGVFVPLKLAFPDPAASHLPVVQVSLQSSLSPRDHLLIGAALAPLRDEGVLIIGSGAMTHNLRTWRDATDAPATWARAFDTAMRTALTSSSSSSSSDPTGPIRALLDWEALPGARNAHPREEHLIPLHVAVGAAAPDLVRHVLGAPGKSATVVTTADGAETAPPALEARSIFDYFFRSFSLAAYEFGA